MEEVKKTAKDTNTKSAGESFFKGVKREFHRIAWPSGQDVIRQTTAVVVISVLVGLLISALDVGFSSLVNLLMSI